MVISAIGLLVKTFYELNKKRAEIAKSVINENSKLYEDVYKVTAIGQGGTKTSWEYDRDSEDDAKTAAIDGFDVPKEDILKVEKMDHDTPQNGEDKRDNGKSGGDF